MEDKYAKLALKEAQKAYKKGEIPVGAVIVKNNKVISRAHNKVENNKNAINHAEILAITKASKRLKNWRLNDCEMYVTLEPCDMCKGAIMHSRISKIYYMLKQKGSSNSYQEYIYLSKYNNKSKKMIQDFFFEIRK